MSLFAFELFAIPVQSNLYARIGMCQLLGEPSVGEGIHGDIDCRTRFTKLGDVQNFQVTIGREAALMGHARRPRIPLDRLSFGKRSFIQAEGM